MKRLAGWLLGSLLFVLACFGIGMALSADIYAARVNDEVFYRDLWCKEQPGRREYRLSDHTRVDCLTKTHAVEVDFADRWYNGVGQALHYAAVTGREPGLLLIVESMGDLKYVERAQHVAMRQDIRIWLIWP